jgi:MFS family permease
MMTNPGAARRGRWAVAAMFLANGFTMGAWAPQIPLLLPRHDISEFTLGLLILVLGLGAVTAMLFAGKLIARFGARRVLQAFSLSIVPVLPAVVFSPNLTVLALAMAALGAMIGCMDVAMNANAVAVERHMGRAIMSSSHGFWSLGGFIGGAFGGQAIATFGYDKQALGVALICAITLAVASRFIVNDPPQEETAVKTKARMFPRVMILYVLGAMALFSMVPEGAVLDWAAVYVKDELGADLTQQGLAFGLFSGAMAIVRFMGDAVRNRFGAVQTLRVSGIFGAVGLIVASLSPSSELAIVGFAIAGIGVANMVPIMFSAAGNYPGLPPGSGIATTTMLGYTGYLLAPSVIGYVAQHVGFRFTYGAVALLLLLVASLASKAAAADGVKA